MQPSKEDNQNWVLSEDFTWSADESERTAKDCA